jgi:acyl carrier protein
VWYDEQARYSEQEVFQMDFETVRDMIAEQLKVNPAEIRPESRLMEDLKADSANIMVMIMDMEDRFGITVEDDQIMKLKTVGDVAAYIAKVKG